MRIRIISDNLSILDHQKEKIEKKLNSLKRYLQRYSLSEIEIIFSQEASKEKGNIFSAQVRLILPGKDLNLEEKGETLDILIHKIYKTLKNQIYHLKEKKQSKLKKIAHLIKEKFFR
ncbi:MAG: HPF/RaiA family ribosome-associated protein [Candidatus Paceibacterota bacterium]